MRKSLSFILCLCIIVSCIQSSPHEKLELIDGELYVQTPYGLMLKECVHNVPSGTHVVEKPDGSLEFTHEKANFQKTVLKSEKCIKNSPAHKLGEWIDNGSVTLTQTLKKFESNYRVPNTPQSTNTQVLYYFIGTENFDSSTIGLTILQPVLTYNQEWFFQSWNCCPQGQAINATPVSGVDPYDIIYGSIEIDDQQSTVISRNKDGQQSVLTVDLANRSFNWIDATLEVYNINDCTNYPTDYIEYSNMKVTLSNGDILQPQWTQTDITQCNGKITVIDPATIRIQHNLPSLEEN